LKTPANIGRRVALRLVRHAAFVLPRGAASWGVAMQHEIEHIDSDRDALRWAVGCVSTGYLRRLASLSVVHTAAIRWLLVVFIASWTAPAFLAISLFRLKLTGESSTVPLLDALPTWSFVFDGVAGILYVAGVYCLIRKKAASVWVLLAGTAVNGIACIGQVSAVLGASQLDPPAQELLRTYLTYAMHFCVIFVLWHGFARGEAR
jgi:hypothetical protein